METEIITIKIHKDKMQLLLDSGAFEDGEYLIVKADVPDFDYTSNQLWRIAKEKSNKAYKYLKEVEFEIRNK